MAGNRIMVVAGDDGVAGVIEALEAAGHEVLHARHGERAVDLVWAGAVDLVVVRWPSIVDLDAVLCAADGRVPVVALAEPGPEPLVELFCRRGVDHVIAAPAGSFEPADLVAAIDAVLRPGRLGFERLLHDGRTERVRHVMMRAEERDELVDRMMASAVRLGGGRRIAEAVGLVGDELLTNAVYNAPRDSAGVPRYAHMSRRHKIVLEPSEYVGVEYGGDDRTFGLAVTDRFGGLDIGRLRTRVERCASRRDAIEQKTGGAGLGLYSAIRSADQLLVAVEGGVRTQVVALWRTDRRGAERRPGGSLHIFMRQPDWPASTPDREAVPEATMSLSDSIKNDLCRALASTSPAEIRFSPPLGTPSMAGAI